MAHLYIKGWVNVFFTSHSTNFMRMSRIYKTEHEAVVSVKHPRQMRTYITTLPVRLPFYSYGITRAGLRELYHKTKK